MRQSKSETVAAAVVALSAILAAAAPGAPRDATVPDSPEAGGCVLRSIDIAADGSDTLLELSSAGNPASIGARIEDDHRVVLELAGCVQGPDLSAETFDDELVSSLELAEMPDGGLAVLEVVIETHRPFDYAVRSATNLVQVRLQPKAPDTSAPGTLVRVLEPLPTVPEPPAQRPGFEKPDASAEEHVAALVERWARAWSDQRVDDYLAAYAPDFRPAGGASRQAWQEHRRQRITAPGFIVVSLEGLKVRQLEPGRAAASFWQTYVSDRFNDRVYKTQTWIRVEGAWKILREEVVTPPDRP